MSNLFKINLGPGLVYPDFEHNFNLAFQDIYNLTKLLCSSTSDSVSSYLSSCIPGDPPWLSYDESNINVCCEGVVVINKSDAINGNLEYDFGKRLPADDNYLFAIMSILKHYIPDSKLFSEVDPYGEEFDNGVLMARLVNSNINNPYKDSSRLSNIDPDIENLCNLLNNNGDIVN